jgi:hypothetical protein
MAPPSVVKSIFVRGTSNDRGEVRVEIERRDADLTVGRWLMAVDSCIVTIVAEPGPRDDVPVSVSATHTLCHIKNSSGHVIQTPARQLMFVLRPRESARFITIAGNSSRWIEVQRPSNVFELVFSNAETDAGILGLHVEALLLFTRVVQ